LPLLAYGTFVYSNIYLFIFIYLFLMYGRLIIERFANITDGTVVGVRAPYLRVGGNEQFSMMTDQFFAYDSSITAPLGRVPIWPYTLHYRYSQ
jgi:hypothetical protein